MTAIFAVALMGLFITASPVAHAVAPDFAPSTQGSNDAGDTTIVPNTSGTNTAGDPTIIPNMGGTNENEGGSVIIPNGQGANTDEPASNPVDNGGGPGNGGGGGPSSGGVTINSGGAGSFIGGSSTIITPATSTIAFVAGGACDYLSDYLKIGGNNSVTEVNKLQAFLKTIEKMDVDITGTFDNKTFEGVKAFQGKYVGDVMGPWGVTTPTGQVYYTTKKKINEIYCNSIVNLTPQQLAEIEAYRNGLTVVPATGTTTNPDGTVSTSTQEVGSNIDNNNPLTAAGANIPFTTKIWNFVKWLFGY